LYLQKLKESGDPKSAALESLKELMSHKNLTMEQTNSLRDIARILEHSTHGDDFSLSEKYFVNTVKGRLTSDLDTQKYLLTFAEQQKAKTNRWVFSKVVNDVRFVRHSVERTASTEDIQHKIYAGPSMSDAVYEELQKIDSWNFDVFKVSTLCNGRPLQIIFHYILHARGFLKEFKIPTNVLENFMEAVETGYHNVPYHNNLHAADVLQSLHIFFQCGIKNMVPDLLQFAGYLAATVHDLGHRGLTNDFLISARDPAAIMYNDRSVNENVHLASAFRLLVQDELNILGGLTKEQFLLVRSQCIDMIFATDMAVHSALLNEFDAECDNNQMGGGSVFSNQTLLMKFVLHAADLSNLLCPLHVSQRWSILVLEEFFTQGDQQRICGQEISPLCDRHTVNISKCQVGFIDFIVRPTMMSLYQVLGDSMNDALANLEKSRLFWLSKQSMHEDVHAEGEGHRS